MKFKSFDWKHLAIVAVSMALISCSERNRMTTIAVKSDLDMVRESETVSISGNMLSDLLSDLSPDQLLLTDDKSGDTIVHQLIDNDGDGRMDELIFQANFEPKEEKIFSVQKATDTSRNTSFERTAYSRFVPERIDDYAWENDRVAFRTYGPKAQQLVDDGEAGGTLTSGIDAWLKKVDYPIIDKWYAAHLENPGAYHIDSGEGYDPYHVGASRGIGGLGIWKDDSLYVSKNFVDYKVIANGPIRTLFELTYAPWNADGNEIKETKRISLDLGSNLARFDVSLDSKNPLSQATVGITLHDKSGTLKTDAESGWVRYWETIDNTQLGTGIVIDPDIITDVQDYRTDKIDQSHLFIHADVKDDALIYYAGFAWVESGQFKNEEEWDQYLADFSKRLASPLQIEIKSQ